MHFSTLFVAIFSVFILTVSAAPFPQRGGNNNGNGNRNTGNNNGNRNGNANTGNNNGNTNNGGNNNGNTNTGNTNGNGNFGSCPTPRIDFGTGFDGRTGTSFQPTDRQSFNAVSATDIGTITSSICNNLSRNCGADDQAQSRCQQAATAARNARPENSGAQADAFNAVFGISTNFASVPVSN